MFVKFVENNNVDKFLASINLDCIPNKEDTIELNGEAYRVASKSWFTTLGTINNVPVPFVVVNVYRI